MRTKHCSLCLHKESHQLGLLWFVGQLTNLRRLWQSGKVKEGFQTWIPTHLAVQAGTAGVEGDLAQISHASLLS